MAKSILDRLKEGDFLTADYVRTYGLIESASFNRLFELEPRLSMSATDAGVLKLDNDDTGVVFKVVSRNRQILFKSFEYNANQTATELIPAPGSGKRIVITYGSIRSESTSGLAYIHDGTFKCFLVYLTNFSSFAAANLHIPFGDNESVKLTSTQGAKNLYVALNYYYESVRTT